MREDNDCVTIGTIAVNPGVSAGTPERSASRACQTSTSELISFLRKYSEYLEEVFYFATQSGCQAAVPMASELLLVLKILSDLFI